jgi:hypothetical protein
MRSDTHTTGMGAYLVPSSVQEMKCADFGSLIILAGRVCEKNAATERRSLTGTVS